MTQPVFLDITHRYDLLESLYERSGLHDPGLKPHIVQWFEDNDIEYRIEAVDVTPVSQSANVFRWRLIHHRLFFESVDDLIMFKLAVL